VKRGGKENLLKAFRIGEADQEFVLKTISQTKLSKKGVLKFFEEVFAFLAYAIT